MSVINSPKILGINHLGIAAKDPEKAKWFFSEVMGLVHLGNELVKEQSTNTKMYESFNYQKGSSPRIELLENETGSEGPIKKFLEKKGGGIHHLAFSVDSIDTTLAYLGSKGVEMIDTTPRFGAHNTSIAFVHPKSTGGILVEFVEQLPAS